MQKIRNWMKSWRGAGVGVAAGLLCLAAVTVSHAATEPEKGKTVVIPVQGQQLCPAGGGQACQIKIECPPINAPGKTICQATIDCPGTKDTVKPKKKPKTE